jgi:two-component system nitrogen regulation response regulator NtrX
MVYEILIVDDQEDIRTLLSDVLQEEGYQTRVAADSYQALEAIKEKAPDLIILDIWLNDSRFDGIGVLDIIKQSFPQIPVVMISGHGSIETAVSILQKGAYDFIEKPFNTDRLLTIVAKGLETARLLKEIAELKKNFKPINDIEGESSKIAHLRKLIQRVGETNSRVLIEGPAGSGKETVARLIHKISPRHHQPFVVVNCATLDPVKFEEILFGYEFKAGTPGFSVQLGLLEQADGGTLYFDEVSDMPLEAQAKILRVLQDQKFQRVGSHKSQQVDIRVLSSTSEDLQELTQKGKFREDLFYRLNVVPIKMPSLNERKEDIPILANHFLQELAHLNGTVARTLSADAVVSLQNYSWPGNVRQLRNVMEWVLIMIPSLEKIITSKMLPSEIMGASTEVSAHAQESLLHLPLREARECFERSYISVHMNRFNGNIARTAQEIGMERTALHRKIKSLNLQENLKTQKL